MVVFSPGLRASTTLRLYDLPSILIISSFLSIICFSISFALPYPFVFFSGVFTSAKRKNLLCVSWKVSPSITFLTFILTIISHLLDNNKTKTQLLIALYKIQSQYLFLI